MVKSITIYKNVGDLAAFQKFYLEGIFPLAHKIPGVIGTNVTSVMQVGDDISPEYEGLQFIIETYFESEEAMSAIVSSPEGQELMQYVAKNSPGELNFFMGREKKFAAVVPTKKSKLLGLFKR